MFKFKLEKLYIDSFDDAARTKPSGLSFYAMFNPESISQNFTIEYTQPQAIGSSGKQLEFSNRPPSSMKLKLVLDESNYGSLIDKANWGPAGNISVSERVNNFFKTTYDTNSSIHQPRWLTLKWGKLNYTCRLASVDITYTSFNREGEPTGAELDIVLKGDILDKDRLLTDNFMSPDVTHFRIVKAGDTLPLLRNAVYGDPSYYTIVAQHNSLDNFRDLQLGQGLYFPPLNHSVFPFKNQLKMNITTISD